MHNTISWIYLSNVKLQKFLNWKLKNYHLYMTQIFTYLKFCYISSSIKINILRQSHENGFLKAFSSNPLMPSGDKRSYKLKETCCKKLQICLNVRDLLLPPGINVINSHKHHSIISRLIISCINYWKPFSIFICNWTLTSVWRNVFVS